MTRKRLRKRSNTPAVAVPRALLTELRDLIATSRSGLSQIVNASLTMLHWRVGDRIRREILKEKRAGYGAGIVSALPRQLEPEFGRGFSEKSLRHMIRFAEVFPDAQILSSLLRQLPWTHFLSIIYLEDPLRRDFYAEMCRIEGWSTRTLQERIQSMLYERTALSKKPAKLIEKELEALRAEDRMTPDLVFRDPYILDFLGLKDAYSERDLEAAILRELESFLLELGAGFAFVARQKRITLDGEDFYIDLLFFHRRLHRLVVVELKLGDFKPADLGQIQLYLNWIDRHERQPGEEKPLGLILCAGKKAERVEYLDLDRDGVHLAEYLTALPPRELLAQRLHEAVQSARGRMAPEPVVARAVRKTRRKE